MRIQAEGGIEYKDFTAASAISRLDALSRTFSFSAASKEKLLLPFKGGESIVVTVDGVEFLTGSIEVVTIQGETPQEGPSKHKIDFSGRDRTGDLLDSTLAMEDLTPPISMKQAIEKVLAHLSIKDVQVIDKATPALFNKAEDILSPEPGQEAFEFIDKLARKRQVLLTSDVDGDIVITQAEAISSGAFLRNLTRDQKNNVLSYSVTFDSTGRYHRYQVESQRNATSLFNLPSFKNSSVANQAGSTVIDNTTRVGRQMVLVAESSGSPAENLRRAQWQANFNKSKGRRYAVTVDGYRNSRGDLWEINRLVGVEDDNADIHDTEMLVNSVEFTIDPHLGSQTKLELLPSNAYTLEIDEPETVKAGKEASLFS